MESLLKCGCVKQSDAKSFGQILQGFIPNIYIYIHTLRIKEKNITQNSIVILEKAKQRIPFFD